MAGIAKALVTATPDVPGFPTTSGYTGSSGLVTIPFFEGITYTLTFSGPAVGHVKNFKPGVAPPPAETFTLYTLKNKGPLSMQASGETIGVGKSLYVLPGKTPVGKVGRRFQSWLPPRLFADPTASVTVLDMPPASISVSVMHTPPATNFFTFNGYNGSGKSARTSAYSAKFNSWSSAKPGPVARSASAVGKITDVIVATGFSTNNTAAFDGSTSTWHSRANTPVERGSLVGGALGGELYVFDGYFGGFKADGSAYTSSTNTWKTALALPPTGRSYPTFGDGLLSKFYAVGGRKSSYYKKVSAYDPTTNTWSAKASDLVARYGQAGGVIKSMMYVVDGSTGSYVGNNDVYDPTTNTWSAKAADTARLYPAAGVLSSKLYVAGGKNSSGVLAMNRVYDTSTNTWSLKSPMIQQRDYLGGAVMLRG